MTIVLTGGGSGGHIIPILTVASELKKLRPDVTLVYIGQTGGKLSDIPSGHHAIDKVYTVRAGKFRRYQGEGWRQIFDLATQVKNIRDAILVLVGIWQSFWLIRRLRPSIIFTRGGYVSVPVALGGKLNGVPYITHDSDSTPSLANRLIARWAAVHAVGLPAGLYPYPKQKIITVGVPVSGDYQPVTTKLQHSYRKEIGLDAYKQILFVTGGGNGAHELNKLVAEASPELLKRYPEMAIVHVAGRDLETHLQTLYDGLLDAADRKRVVVKGFLTDMYRYSGAADVVVARAGATTLAELAVQGKACVIIPSKQLTWQGHHAHTLAAQHAIIDLPEAQAAKDGQLYEAVRNLLDHQEQRVQLGNTLAEHAVPDAAARLAVLLLDTMKG